MYGVFFFTAHLSVQLKYMLLTTRSVSYASWTQKLLLSPWIRNSLIWPGSTLPPAMEGLETYHFRFCLILAMKFQNLTESLHLRSTMHIGMIFCIFLISQLWIPLFKWIIVNILCLVVYWHHVQLLLIEHLSFVTIFSHLKSLWTLISFHFLVYRGLFIIDPKGIIRHVTLNDVHVGRNVDETVRLIQAYQHTDTHNEVCPAGWKPGEKTVSSSNFFVHNISNTIYANKFWFFPFHNYFVGEVT